jgi:Fur family transcriptional regulator, ferric uptake regulator
LRNQVVHDAPKSVSVAAVARRSPVRDAVQELLQGPEHRAWLIEELLAEVRRTDRRTNPSSVFRAVIALQRSGVAQRVDLGDGRHRYEASGEHHEHITCQDCGRVAEIEGRLLEAATSRVQRLTGFEVTDHRLVLCGLCPECQQQQLAELRSQLGDLE